jgi:GPI mannosyltransferase 1 subunit M
VIYFPALLLYSLSHLPPPSHHHRSHRIWGPSSAAISKEKSKQQTSTSAASGTSELLLEKINALLNQCKLFPIHVSALPFTIQFILCTVVTFLIPTLVSYLAYGDDYLNEALLYHFGRCVCWSGSHSLFSSGLISNIISLPISSGCMPVKLIRIVLEGSSFSLWRPCSLRSVEQPASDLICSHSFQVLLFALTTWSLAQKDLPACFLILSFIFVSFNKVRSHHCSLYPLSQPIDQVCTAQYFTWYACFLPALANKLNLYSSNRIISILAMCWVGAVGSWLNQAHKLEFLGQSNFLGIWISSLIFHIVNVFCIICLILHFN